MRSVRVQQCTRRRLARTSPTTTSSLNFGVYDMLARMFRGATVENISGMAQQARNHDFDRPINIAL